ncbi:MAG: Mu transposase C-terminal domain-containing protein [Terriglobia bacterium]
MTAWGRAARPWLTAFMDMKSRRITGWTLSLQPDSLTIASALRMGLEECGLPQALYLDNGKDFRSRYLGGRTRRLAPIDLPDEARGLLDELGVAVICATPFHPQAKSIERFFRTMHVQFDAAFPSYCGQRPGKRPETCQPLLDEHRDCLQRGVPEASPLPSIEETALTLALWLQEEYHQQPHRGRGMRGRTPAEVYEPSDRRINPGKLALLLLKRERRQVDRGAVTLFGRRYEAEGNALFFHNSHTAQVCYDPHNRVFADLREVLVVCCGQAFHCRHFGEPETYEDLRQRLRARRRLTKLTERCLAELDRRASIASPGERRRLAVAAALPAGIDPRTPDRAQLAAPVTPPVLSEAEGSAAERPLPETPGVAQPDYGAAARRVFTSYTEADDDAGS